MGQGPKNQLVKGVRDKMRCKIPLAIEKEKKKKKREREREELKRNMKKRKDKIVG